jgi:hypothetical protein
MTSYQKGSRDALLNLEIKLREMAVVESEQATKLMKHKGDRDGRLSGAPLYRESAYLMAAHLAHRLSEALPEEPASDVPPRPHFRVSPSGLYVVKQFDGFDTAWIKLHSKPFKEEDAIQYWLSKTDNGTKHASYSDIDYYKIFPVEEV